MPTFVVQEWLRTMPLQALWPLLDDYEQLRATDTLPHLSALLALALQVDPGVQQAPRDELSALDEVGTAVALELARRFRRHLETCHV